MTRTLGTNILILAALFPFLYAFGFCQPQGDDFDEFTRSMFFADLPGALYEVAREWCVWSGRYASNFLAVFFGKATGSGPLYALVCLLCLGSYGFGVWLLVRPFCNRPQLPPILTLVAILAFYSDLPNIYLYTDALTIILQGGATLLFLACFCRFYASGLQSWSRQTLLAGIFAIGVYEYSALCVFWICLGFSILLGWRQILVRSATHKKLLWVYGCLGLAFLASFLAPGNLSRKAARPLESHILEAQLDAAFGDWGYFLWQFLQSPWVPGAICLGLLTASLSSKRLIPAKFVWMFPSIFAAMSLSAVFLQAFSDAPFGSSPKFAAALGVYAALALACMVYVICSRIRVGRISGLCAALVFFIFVFSGDNYQRVFINAFSGEYNLLAEFMGARRQYLKTESSGRALPPFGIWGEILDPSVRKRGFAQSFPVASVSKFAYEVYPVYMAEALKDDPDLWPNTWAAWMYGVGRMKVVERRPEIGNLEDGLSLIASPPLPVHVRIMESAGPNQDVSQTWLDIEGKLGKDAVVFVPLPINPKRLAPLSFQEYLLEKLLASPLPPKWLLALTSRKIMLTGELAPLHYNYEGLVWPQTIFLSTGDGGFFRLSPAL